MVGGGTASGAGTCQRSSNASSLVIGIVRTTTVKGVGGESGSGCGSLFLPGCNKAAAAEQTHHRRIVMPVSDTGCSRGCIRMFYCPSPTQDQQKTRPRSIGQVVR